ncbi:hypothetical protein NQZ79_g7390 [Umbelopsis isabellina]|nr:hypothetical protein NQZ79_g7390 [Umbelopsis isabellina]
MIRTNRSSSNPPSPSLVPLMTTSIQDEEQDLSSLMPSQPTISWDSLRKQARQLENEIETKLASLSKAGSNLRRKGAGESSGSTPQEVNDLEYDTEELIKQVGAASHRFHQETQTKTFIYLATKRNFIHDRISGTAEPNAK